MDIIVPADITVIIGDDGHDMAKLQAYCDDANAIAVARFPIIESEDFPESKLAAVKAVLRGALLRALERGTGAIAGQTIGTYGLQFDTAGTHRFMFQADELAELANICTVSRIVTISRAPQWRKTSDYSGELLGVYDL